MQMQRVCSVAQTEYVLTFFLYYDPQMHNHFTSYHIGEIIVHLLVTVRNNKICTVHELK